MYVGEPANLHIFYVEICRCKTHEACAQQVKTEVVAHQAHHDNGPFGQTQQQTAKLAI
jgi:hypothetical protein